MNSSADIKIINYNDAYARDTISMWRDSKEKALGVKEVHDFDDHLNFYEKHGFTIIGRGHANEENLPDLRYEWVKN